MSLTPESNPVPPTPAPAPRPLVPPKPLAPAFNKLPDSPSFVSPMPAIEEADDSIPVFLPIVAAFAAIGAIAVAVLLYLKNAS